MNVNEMNTTVPGFFFMIRRDTRIHSTLIHKHKQNDGFCAFRKLTALVSFGVSIFRNIYCREVFLSFLNLSFFIQLNDLMRGQLTALQERLHLNLVHQSQLMQQLSQCKDKKLVGQVITLWEGSILANVTNMSFVFSFNYKFIN